VQSNRIQECKKVTVVNRENPFCCGSLRRDSDDPPLDAKLGATYKLAVLVANAGRCSQLLLRWGHSPRSTELSRMPQPQVRRVPLSLQFEQRFWKLARFQGTQLHCRPVIPYGTHSESWKLAAVVWPVFVLHVARRNGLEVLERETALHVHQLVIGRGGGDDGCGWVHCLALTAARCADLLEARRVVCIAAVCKATCRRVDQSGNACAVHRLPIFIICMAYRTTADHPTPRELSTCPLVFR